MMFYLDGNQVRVGDQVLHSTASAVVEEIIEGDEVLRWEIEGPGFMLICDECGRVLIEPNSYDWEDVSLVRRGE
jgi:hypothetical protein